MTSKFDVGKNTLEVMREAVWYNKWFFSFFEKHLKGNILEVGAGIGNFSDLLLTKGNVTTIDIRHDYLQKVKNTSSKLLVGYGDIEKDVYFFEAKLFDVIVCLNVLEHIADDRKALANMVKLLKDGGRLVLLVPAHRALYSNFDKEIGHFRRYAKNDLKERVKSVGLKVKLNRYFNWWGALGWYIFLTLSGSKKMPEGEVFIFDTFGKIFLWPEKFINLPFGLSVLLIAEK